MLALQQHHILSSQGGSHSGGSQITFPTLLGLKAAASTQKKWMGFVSPARLTSAFAVQNVLLDKEQAAAPIKLGRLDAGFGFFLLKIIRRYFSLLLKQVPNLIGAPAGTQAHLISQGESSWQADEEFELKCMAHLLAISYGITSLRRECAWL